MATLKLAEPVIDAMIAKLRAGMDARIQQINASAGDDQATINAPGAGDYYFGGTSDISQAPAVIVFQLPTDGEHEAEGPHSFVWVAEIGVALVEQDHDRQRLARKLLRLNRAAVETLWDDEPRERLAGSAFQIKFVRDDPGPVQEPAADTSVWRAMHLAIFRVWQSEG